MEKRDELKDGTITRVADDEPVFVLRAKDRLAPDVVRTWAVRAERAGVNRTKVDEALSLAVAMKRWQMRNGTRLPD